MTSAVRKSLPIAGSPFVPVAVVLVLAGLALLLAQVSPGRVHTGIYQVVVWEGMAQVAIPAESLSCTRAGDRVTCATTVAGERLTVALTYNGTAAPGGCTAEYLDRLVSCARQQGYYGHASNTVWLYGLGLTSAQHAELAAATPWWRVADDLARTGMVAIGVLGALAGVATFLLRRRVQPLASRTRVLVVMGTGVLGIGLFFVSGHLLGNAVTPLGVVVLLPMAGLVAWQCEATGRPLGGRLGSAVVAAGATAWYAGTALLVFGLQSGFLD